MDLLCHSQLFSWSHLLLAMRCQDFRPEVFPIKNQNCLGFVVRLSPMVLFIRLVLGAIHNCQHLCIRTERTEGERGTRPAYTFLNVDIFELLPPGGYD